MNIKHHTYRCGKFFCLLVLAPLVLLVVAVSAEAQLILPDDPPPPPIPAPAPTPVCERTIKADVVALDQAIIYNRLGTINPNGMIYALK